MITDRGILFSVFDRQKGPIPIFAEEISKEEAKFIGLRSQMTLSMMDSTKIETAEAILPFSGINKLGFILLFQIPTVEGSKRVASLIYLVPQDQQVFLYNKVSFLKFTAEEIATQIKQIYRYSEEHEFPKQLASSLREWRVTEKDTTAEIQILERKVTLSEKKDTGSVSFFLSQVKKNEDRALGAIYRGKTVFVTGDAVLVDLMVHSMDLLVPILNLRKIGYTKSIIDPSYADIIGISKDLVKNYPNEVLIDLEKKQVKNGETCHFSKELIKLLRKKPENTDEILSYTTKKLLEVVGLLVDAFSYPEDERNQKIDEIKKKYDTNLVELSAEIGGQRNPLIREMLLNKVSNRFVDWMTEL
ncbi:MAG: hypothetical protein ACFFAU_15305 [Candidatus Hodarchaeota archaeon]